MTAFGHSGVSQTLAVLHQHFHWPGVKADVAAYVKQCHACQMQRLEHQTYSTSSSRCLVLGRYVRIELCVGLQRVVHGPETRATLFRCQRL